MRAILFSLDFETQFNELSRVAQVLAESGELTPIFCFGSPEDATSSRVRERCRAAGWRTLFFPDFVRDGDRRTPRTIGLRARDLFRGHLQAGGFLARYLEESDALRRHKIGASLVLDDVRPALVVFPEDGLGANRPLIWAARQRGLKTLVVPYEFSTTRQPLEAIRSSPDRDSVYATTAPGNRMAARLFPRWRMDAPDGKGAYLRLPGPRLLAEEMHGTAPLLPWQVHGGKGDALAVESPRMEEHYRSQGLPGRKLRLVGASYDDLLSRARGERDARRRALVERHSLTGQRPLVLCSIPGDYVAARKDLVTDYGSYGELVDTWIETLTSDGRFDVLAKPHPAVPEESREAMRKRGVPVTDDDIAGLIPLADLLVTSVSSIIRMAIASAVPVINFDVYRFRYTDYREVGGVVHVETREAFTAEIQRLKSDPDYLAMLRTKQRADAERWGFQDGATRARILALVRELATPG